ncbi:kinetochore protein NUF2 homolog isoform X2 [Tripterygium wilfordii]|uniref:kinetochore protein NUF2 homolog isoform X2 n=1 Tax=Tripterygium wilfordii TaxID=458696 RepID=UPI0018F7F3EE|nr:kinetochore protein NUF2 homolog isoform X2 [Tripterygium wilfordii]
MSKFEYPELSRAEMVTILRESQVAKITENDLKNLSSDFVSDLYTRFLIYLDILHEEYQGQVEFAALEQLENPDFHVDSVRVMNLCNRIKEVVISVDCPVIFTLKDLIRPDTINTELFLSGILNFCLYKNSKMNDLRPIAEALTLLDEKRKEWEAKISQLNADISGYYEARDRELPFVQDIDVQVKQSHQTIAGLNSHQMLLRASFRKLKDKTVEMSEKISKAEFELVQSVQENVNLHSKIFQSPDKLQRALEEKKSVQKGAKNSERSAMQSFQERNAILEVYLKAFRKMSKHFALMQNIQEQDELRIQLEKERNLKFKEANTELNNVKLDVESRRLNLEARQRNVEAAIAEVDAITVRTNFVKESGEAKLQKLARKCEEVVEQFQRYTNSLGLLLPMVELEPNVVL